MSLPIQDLIIQRCRELGLRRNDLLQRSGYKNISKGIRRLEQVYAGDLEKAGSLLRGLPQALDLSPDTVYSEPRTDPLKYSISASPVGATDG